MVAITYGAPRNHTPEPRQGANDQSRKWFDNAVAWTNEKTPKNMALHQLSAEAAQLRGHTGPDAAPAAAKPR
jgi:hypothetical protein